MLVFYHARTRPRMSSSGTQLTFAEVAESWPVADGPVRDRAARPVRAADTRKLAELMKQLRSVLDDSPALRRVFWREAKGRWRPKNPVPDGASVRVASRLVREAILDRLAAKVEAGELDLDEDDNAMGEVAITQGEYATLLHWMMPEEFPAELPAAAAVDAPPGSPAKLAVMADRLRRGESLYHAGDPGMSSGGKVAEVVTRGNRGNRRYDHTHADRMVVGWVTRTAAEPGDDDAD